MNMESSFPYHHNTSIQKARIYEVEEAITTLNLGAQRDRQENTFENI